ncbi:Glutaredoxin [Ophidiomyces ophidiicola]|nr:Glutaredoxin [Ophidiomyces ophidiicola]KAI1982824.1 Glutaredoxin [Ophidiomyces ophidiicola]KAI1984589.1 Glutaredoxin [Ophidiomyces ophidiicola]KAI1998115.1 Glutaredoxin [Ophidiomyces ophidiicola]
MAAAKQKTQQVISDHAVVVFSKSYCPYCTATKNLLTLEGADFYTMELDQVDDGAAIQNALEEITHQRTVPNIFIKQKHIGGNFDLQARKGELKSLLKEAGALKA